MTAAPEVAPVKPGDVIAGKYRIERILGEGGMGVVMVATHLQLDQPVAIKFLLPSVAQNAEAVARFAREARAAAKIQSEHVARVLDVATHESGAPYMVMEYLNGHDLEHALQRHGSLPIERVVGYLLQALEALAEAHVAGIVHRDLKPANIFLTQRADGSTVTKVLDFGISKLVRDKDPQITTTSVQMGSPLYMSPEQLRGSKDVDARSDIWAIGVVLQELVTGSPPFMADSLPKVVAAILTAPPETMRLRMPDVPAELEAVVARCLQKDPEGRFSNVAELAVALAPFGPTRGAVSVERIMRVIAGKKEGSLAPAKNDGVRSPGAIHMARTGTAASWDTSSVLQPNRSGRKIALAVASVLVLGVVFFLARPEHMVSPVADPPPRVTIASPPSASTAPVASAAPVPETQASLTTVAASAPPMTPLAPRVVPMRMGPSAHGPAPTTPPLAVPNQPDFGGRK